LKRKPSAPPSEGQILGIVIMDYTPSPYDEDAIPLKAGDEVIILDKNASGMWKGKKVSDGEIGVFPFRYIELPDDESDDGDSD